MDYIPVLILLGLGALVGIAATLLSYFIGPKIPHKMKDLPFECGVPPVGTAKHRISVRFYLIAILFLLFDVEAVFFFPFAISFREYLGIDTFILIEMGVFVGILLIGYLYVLGKRSLGMGMMEGGDIRTPVSTIYGDLQKKFSEIWQNQANQIKEVFGSAIECILMPGEHPTDVPIVFVKKDQVINVLKFLKEEPGFQYNFLADLTATDETPREPRFDVVYQLLNPNKFWRLRVKASVRDGESVPTAISLWTGANWAEREVWDMFGIKFEGHPDLRRILMDERWVGHPLRKDYPIRGYQLFPTPEQIHSDLLE